VAPLKSTSRPGYDTAGLFKTLDAELPYGTATQVVTNVEYTAMGQRSRISYGNGTMTQYTYDPLTQRLVSLVTSRSDGSKIQNLQYVYDASGNITNITDSAQQTIFFKNTVVDPSSSYIYDAINRLVQATGREHVGQLGTTAPGPWDPDAGANGQDPRDGQAMARYIESYFYDQMNNIQSVRHAGSNASTPGWTRTYAYAEPSPLQPGVMNNRLSYTTVGSATSQYKYDGTAGLCGCMTSMPHLSVLNWGFNNMIQSSASQMVNSGIPEMTYFQYDATNTRSRKVTHRQAPEGQTPTRKSERIYIGSFEIYREFASNGTDVTLERQSVGLSDGSRRVVLAETRTIGTEGSDPAPQQLLRYQFTNHLNSSCLELDGTSALISYEEYTPYGSSSYRATQSSLNTPKRYRYASKERDEETGFYNYGARWYAPWLGRWTSADPAGISDGYNLYTFVGDNPIMKGDSNGMQSGPPTNDPDVVAFFLKRTADFATDQALAPDPNNPGGMIIFGKLSYDWLGFRAGQKAGVRLGLRLGPLVREATGVVPGAERLMGEMSIRSRNNEVTKVWGSPLPWHKNLDLPLLNQGQTINTVRGGTGTPTIATPGFLAKVYELTMGRNKQPQARHSVFGAQPAETIHFDYANEKQSIPNANASLPPSPAQEDPSLAAHQYLELKEDPETFGPDTRANSTASPSTAAPPPTAAPSAPASEPAEISSSAPSAPPAETPPPEAPPSAAPTGGSSSGSGSGSGSGTGSGTVGSTGGGGGGLMSRTNPGFGSFTGGFASGMSRLLNPWIEPAEVTFESLGHLAAMRQNFGWASPIMFAMGRFAASAGGGMVGGVFGGIFGEGLANALGAGPTGRKVGGALGATSGGALIGFAIGGPAGAIVGGLFGLGTYTLLRYF
jgi:RHS repeat-associated protein